MTEGLNRVYREEFTEQVILYKDIKERKVVIHAAIWRQGFLAENTGTKALRQEHA